jgi:hypothetical protein
MTERLDAASNDDNNSADAPLIKISSKSLIVVKEDKLKNLP